MVKTINGKMMSAGEVLDILGIPQYKLDYLFQARRLRDADFQRFNGRRIYTEEDIPKIKEALFLTQNK